MNCLLNFEPHSKVRVWLDELPFERVESRSRCERVLPHASVVVAEPRKAALEVLIAKGPIGMYGLLGAELTPGPSDTLIVHVDSGARTRVAFDNSLALRSDPVEIGLREEFAGEVLIGTLDQLKAKGPLPSGVLSFCCAATSTVGSNRAVFKQLASLVVKLILLDDRNPRSQELSTILQNSGIF